MYMSYQLTHRKNRDFSATSTASLDRTHGYRTSIRSASFQRWPTPLLLQYGESDYNCAHQDLYGEHVFPIQVAVLLLEPGRDFARGDLVLTEQRPGMQWRVEVVQGTRGTYRLNPKHGVSRIRRGHRHTSGIIFQVAE
jgi:hypothetical protein